MTQETERAVIATAQRINAEDINYKSIPNSNMHKSTKKIDIQQITNNNNAVVVPISTAKSRMNKTWANESTTWGQLAAQCQEAKRTNETMAQYDGMSKDERTNIKDVGGFVGCHLRDGRRKKGNGGAHRILTLDADEVPAGINFVEEVSKALHGAEWFIYSSHSHRPDAQRFRLVVLLSRTVDPDEYEPIIRLVADKVGISYFDSCSFQCERLMFWPSVGSDAELVYHRNDGTPLDVDSLLSGYANYLDPNEWPRANGESTESVKQYTEAKKQQDPTTKDGPIGDFCRAYSIGDAIDTFLTDIYKEGENGRYTFIGGSSANGLVLYDGIFAYSHHSTDPVHGQLLNAFDLVRLHRFGHLDSDGDKRKDDTTKTPSFSQMCDLVNNDGRVMAVKSANACGDFDGIEIESHESFDWLSSLKRGKKKELICSIENCETILNNDPRLKGMIKYDEFKCCRSVVGSLPWNQSNDARMWSDFDDSGLRGYMEKVYEFKGKSTIDDAINNVSQANKFHPVRNYLNGLPEWDGKHRLDKLFIDYLGAEDTPLNRAMTRKSFVAAVARVMVPATKFDYCLITIGSQGAGKSSLLGIMGGEWFSDSVVNIQGKEGMESLSGAWLVELAELSVLNRSEAETIKAFLSKQSDKFRVAYGRYVEEHKRQCVFFGTTNVESVLRGSDGNRRMWPIEIDTRLRKFKNTAEMRADLISNRDMIWAEALHYYNQCEPLYLDDELEAEANKAQSRHNASNEDALMADILRFLEIEIPVGWESMGDFERKTYYSTHRAFKTIVSEHDADIFQSTDQVKPMSATYKRNAVVWQDFVFDYLGLSPTDKDANEMKRRFNACMKSVDGWKQTDKTTFLPHAPRGKQQHGFKRES